MNDKTFRAARLVRLAIILGILFLFAWMFRWDIGTSSSMQYATSYPKLDRWTGATYLCRTNLTAETVSCIRPTNE